MTHHSWVEIQELRSQVQELDRTVVSQNFPPTDSISVPQRSQVCQMSTTNNSIIGERNDQAHNPPVRRAGAITLRCRVQSTTLIPFWNALPASRQPRTNGIVQMPKHAVFARICVVLTSSYRTADVHASGTSIKPIANVPLVPGAKAKDDPISGDTCILVFNESLCYSNKLDHTLLNPNQLRAYGIQSYAFTVNRSQPDTAHFATHFWY
jgi:hypothetical protein